MGICTRERGAEWLREARPGDYVLRVDDEHVSCNDLTQDNPADARLRLGVAALLHDVSNLATTLLGSLQVAQQAASELREVEAPLGSANEAAKQLQELARGAQRWLASEDRDEAPDAANGADEIDRIVGLLRCSAPDWVRLQKVVRSASIGASIGTASLDRVLLNLGLNAVQSLHKPSGTVEFGVDRVDISAPVRADVGELQTGSYMRLWVKDDGKGIPPEEQKQIFSPGVTNRVDGSGIGLASCAQIVVAARGGMNVESSAGVGSCFEVFLPAAEGAEA